MLSTTIQAAVTDQVLSPTPSAPLGAPSSLDADEILSERASRVSGGEIAEVADEPPAALPDVSKSDSHSEALWAKLKTNSMPYRKYSRPGSVSYGPLLFMDVLLWTYPVVGGSFHVMGKTGYKIVERSKLGWVLALAYDRVGGELLFEKHLFCSPYSDGQQSPYCRSVKDQLPQMRTHGFLERFYVNFIKSVEHYNRNHPVQLDAAVANYTNSLDKLSELLVFLDQTMFIEKWMHVEIKGDVGKLSRSRLLSKLLEVFKLDTKRSFFGSRVVSARDDMDVEILSVIGSGNLLEHMQKYASETTF